MKQEKQRLTRGAKRTLNAFSKALADMISHQSFESVTVNALCEQADYPRSTFYNYFEDKFDLLNDCFSQIVDEIRLTELTSVDDGQLLLTSFDRLYDLMSQHIEYIRKVLVHNSDGYLQTSFTNYARRMAQDLLVGKLNISQEIPDALVVDHCLSTVLMVLDWVFIKRNIVDKNQAQQYLVRLYGKPELLA